jgi:hypothetical protein
MKKQLISLRLIRRAAIFAHETDGNLGGSFSKLSIASKNELLLMAQDIADNLNDVYLPRSNFEAYIRAFLKLNKLNK